VIRRSAWPCALLLTVALAAAARAQAGDAVPRSAEAIVEAAFDRMFNYPSVRSVTLRIERAGRTSALRAFEIAYAKSEGRGRTLLRFTAPDYLRGSALLILEEADGRNDVWIYQPELRRARRVVASHKGDAFFGSDLSFEDLEHHAWRRFRVARLPDAREQDRDCYVVAATPPADSQYSRIVVFVERERLALLRVDFHRGGSAVPQKTLVVAPAEIEGGGAILRPRRMRMLQHGREAATEVVFERIESEAPIAGEVFGAMRLERSGEDLFELVERLRAEEKR
jgi:hypothetical protein